VSGARVAAPGTILVATRSRHKLAELRDLLQLPEVDLVDVDDVGIADEPVEDADSFRGNALIKARFYAAASGLPTLADDSGLEVDALDGGPGVRTRRYASETATDEENNAKLLRELADLHLAKRTARYRCVLAWVDPSADESTRRAVTRSGTFEGRIALAPRGTSGFGYDPIFEPATEPEGGRTVGQLTQAEKNRVSHRAKAARAMARYLRGAWSRA
jgi:XTP/dITP diphosphohydrolase